MLGPLLLLLAQASSSPPLSSQDIVVIGHRAEQALAACLARKCSPGEEIEAALQAGVEQFVDGRYEDAEQTLRSAIRRNRDHAAELPGPVSTLYATLATVAEHEGKTDLWESSARNNVLVLRQHLGAANIATLGQELAFADSVLALRGPIAAVAIYRRVEQLAAGQGATQLAAGAVFRRAWLAFADERYKDAQRLADEAVTMAGPGDRLTVELRDILLARIAIRRGDERAVDRLAARLRQSPAKTPLMLFEQPVANINPDQQGGARGSSHDSVQQSMTQDPWYDARIHFADVGYWIRPDGRTADVEVLRTSGLDAWKPGILRSVRGRRYIPLEVKAGDPGIYRIDRFTVRGTMGTPLGTRIVQRMGNLTVHVIDLTGTDAMMAAHRQHSNGAAATPGS